MRETPLLILSLVLHGAMLVGASLAGAWIARETGEAHASAAPATFGGFHGNTVDIEGLTEEEHGSDGDDEDSGRAAESTEQRPVNSSDATPAPAPKPEPQGEKRKKPRRRARKADAGDGDGKTSEGSGGNARGDGRGGKQFGSREGARGVKDLALAFTAAVPQAVSGDKVWSELPFGDAGSVEIALVVTDGKIVRHVVPEEAPRHLRRIVKRTLPLLLAGRYALGEQATGKERLRLSATISQRDVRSAEDEERKVLELGHEEPANGKPGRAYFTLASGRHVVVTVAVIH